MQPHTLLHRAKSAYADFAVSWEGAGEEILRATRSWIQFGTVAFAVMCIVIGAVEALFGR